MKVVIDPEEKDECRRDQQRDDPRQVLREELTDEVAGEGYEREGEQKGDLDGDAAESWSRRRVNMTPIIGDGDRAPLAGLAAHGRREQQGAHGRDDEESQICPHRASRYFSARTDRA